MRFNFHRVKQPSITNSRTFPAMSGMFGRETIPVANTRCLTVRVLASLPSRLTSTVHVFVVSFQDDFLMVDAVQTLSSRNFAYPSNQSASYNRYNQQSF